MSLRTERRRASVSALPALTFMLLLASAAPGVACAEPTPAAREEGKKTPDPRGRDFTPEETARLLEGRLVTRPEKLTVGEARFFGGMAWQRIDAPASRVWKTLTDTSSYPHFLPSVDEALVVDSGEREQRLFIHHSYGPISASYYVLMSASPARRRLRFRLDRSRAGSLRDAYGELRVTPLPDGQSVVSMVIMADIGPGLLTGVVRSHVHEWMLRVPEQLKNHVERSLRAEQAKLQETSGTAPKDKARTR